MAYVNGWITVLKEGKMITHRLVIPIFYRVILELDSITG